MDLTMSYEIGPTETRLRKLRREYIMATGISPLKSNTVLVLAPNVWQHYLVETKLAAREAIRGSVTFEGVHVIVDHRLPQDVAYFAEESEDERRSRETFRNNH
jgi:hypothetical protein